MELDYFHSSQELIEDIRLGKMVVLVDDEDRENEGDLVVAADHITPELVNFMALHARGLICLSLTKSQVERLKLPLMVKEDLNQTSNKTAFTVSIEASSGVSTGISAHDRAHTIRVASNPKASSLDVHTPGHVFPIRAQDGGVLKRAGHTEGSVDLARLAGLNPAAVICEVMNPDGTMARLPDLKLFAQKHGLKIGSIVDLIKHRLRHERLVERVGELSVDQWLGAEFKLIVFKSLLDSTEHIVVKKGQIDAEKPCLVRVHVENSVRDVVASLNLQADTILQRAVRQLQASEAGVVLILRNLPYRESILDALRLLSQQQKIASAGSMDQRDFGIGAQILLELGIKKVKLLSSSKPEQRPTLKAFGMEVVEVLSF